jgi:hypothetical protein
MPSPVWPSARDGARARNRRSRSARGRAAPGPTRARAGGTLDQSALRRTRAARAALLPARPAAARPCSRRSRARRPGRRAARAGDPSRRAWRAARGAGNPACSSSVRQRVELVGQNRRVDHERLSRLLVNRSRPCSERRSRSWSADRAGATITSRVQQGDRPHAAQATPSSLAASRGWAPRPSAFSARSRASPCCG